MSNLTHRRNEHGNGNNEKDMLHLKKKEETKSYLKYALEFYKINECLPFYLFMLL
jgi:hypothetical protein